MLNKVQKNKNLPKFIPQFLLKMIRIGPNIQPQSISNILSSQLNNSNIENILKQIDFKVLKF